MDSGSYSGNGSGNDSCSARIKVKAMLSDELPWDFS